MNLDQRETALMMAAMKFWNREGQLSGGIEQDIATGNGLFEQLSSVEVSALCSRLKSASKVHSYSVLAERLDQIIQCFSEHGKFNSHTAPFGTKEIREAAVAIRDSIQTLGESESVSSVMMQDLVGDYDLPDTVVEWKWVADNASYHHRHNGQLGVYEFMLNVSRTFDDVPERLQAVLASSKQAGIAYLLVHQGT